MLKLPYIKENGERVCFYTGRNVVILIQRSMISATESAQPVLVAHSLVWSVLEMSQVQYDLILLLQTGLCVYEVDDPRQRTDAQDESSRLIKRVAELEGVIREVCHHVSSAYVSVLTTEES